MSLNSLKIETVLKLHQKESFDLKHRGDFPVANGCS